MLIITTITITYYYYYSLLHLKATPLLTWRLPKLTPTKLSPVTQQQLTSSSPHELIPSVFSLAVKPDPPQCQYVATNGTVTWTYPRTWSTPNSYFPLTFKVKVKSTKRRRYQVETQHLRHNFLAWIVEIIFVCENNELKLKIKKKKWCWAPKMANSILAGKTFPSSMSRKIPEATEDRKPCPALHGCVY